jgi:pimeloyl-ACP methyl ester carboxylesterase
MPAVYAALRAEGAGDAALPAEVEEFLRQRFLASSVAGYFGMAEAMLREPDLVDRLRATGMPTLVCFGEQDDAWTPAAQREMAARLAAQVAVIAAAGHSPAVDRPAQTAAALTAFWSTH